MQSYDDYARTRDDDAPSNPPALLPCPFCGDAAYAGYPQPFGGKTIQWVGCVNPACLVETQVQTTGTVDEALETAAAIWNRRAG